MIFKVRHARGVVRITVPDEKKIQHVYDCISSELNLLSFDLRIVPDAPSSTLNDFRDSSFSELQMANGQELFVVDEVRSPIVNVDDVLERADGRIKRDRDALACNHNKNSMCVNCMPLDPYDPKYLEEHKIKHLTFHAFRRLLKEKKEELKPTELDGLILKRQPFRLVDYVEFENTFVAEPLISYWRKNSKQRFSFAFGSYQTQSGLGVRALVRVLYEPPQTSSSEGFELLEHEPPQRLVVRLSKLGLQLIGCLYTKVDAKEDKIVEEGLPRSQELLFSALLQSENQLARYNFGSRFVSIVARGESSGIGMYAYMASEQAERLCSLRKIVPLKKNLVGVRGGAEIRYFTKENDRIVSKDKVTEFPSEFLLVEVPCGIEKRKVSEKYSDEEEIEAKGPLECTCNVVPLNRGLSSKEAIRIALSCNSLYSVDNVVHVGMCEALNDAEWNAFCASVLTNNEYGGEWYEKLKDYLGEKD